MSPDLKAAINKVKGDEQPVDTTITSIVADHQENIKTEPADELDGMFIGDPMSIQAEEQINSSTNTADEYAALRSDILANRPEGKLEDSYLGNSEVEGVKVTTIAEWSEKLKKRIEDIGISAETADIEHRAIMEILTRKRKSLIMEGFDDLEVEEVMIKRFEKEVTALESKYTGKSEVITVEASSDIADKIEFSDDDKKKLEKSEKIQFVKVEKKEINVSKIKKLVKGDTKLKYMQGMNTRYVSKYTIPLPLTGEFATFRGALFVELFQAKSGDEATLQDIAAKKAALAYKHYLDGYHYHIKDEKNKTIMSYSDFISHFRYHDLDLMVFAISCASSAPMTAADLTCPECQHRFKHEFPISSLLDMSRVSKKIKATFDAIIQNHTQLNYIETLVNECDELYRCESPITNNIYDIGTPSIDRAIKILSLIDKDNTLDLYLVSMALFVHSLFVYDPEEDKYISFSEEEYEEMFEAIKLLPQSELTMLQDVTSELGYTPSFIMNSTCPECSSKLRNPIPINDMVFFVNPPDPETVKSKNTKH